MKLREFHVAIGAFSQDDPGCREISYSAAFEDRAGEVVHHHVDSLVFDGMLDDPDQIPWLIASTLRSLLGRSTGG